MKYQKPTLKIEKFDLKENITAEDISANVNVKLPVIEENDPIFDVLGEALGNVFDIGR